MKQKYIRIGLLIIILLVAIFLRFYDLGAVEYIGDECHDIPVAVAYYNSPNPFDLNDRQKLDDLSQARLPYYIAALSFFLSGNQYIQPSSYWQARIVFVFFGIGTILVLYLLGRAMYDSTTGILSALLLSISSYHIGFSRCAVTTGEVCLGFFYILALYLFYKGMMKSDIRYVLYSGIMTGLACASKFSGVLLLPTFFIFLAFFKKQAFCFSKNSLFSRRMVKFTLLNLIMICLFLNISMFWNGKNLDNQTSWIVLKIFLAGSLVYVILLNWLIFKRPVHFKTNEIILIFINMVLLAIIFTFMGSPVHLKPENFSAILASLSMDQYSNAKTSYKTLEILSIISFKLIFPFNLLFCSGFLSNMVKRTKANILLVISVTIYLLALFTLKIIVGWYLIAIISILYLIGARELMRYYSCLNSQKAKICLVVVTSIVILIQFLNVLKIAPYFHLDGYKWGENFIGLDKPAFLSLDGCKDSVEWIEKNALDNSRVGFLVNFPDFRECWQSYYKSRMSGYISTNVGLYKKNQTIEYVHIDNFNDVLECDYVVASAWFGAQQIDGDRLFKQIYSISHAGLEVFKIFKHQ